MEFGDRHREGPGKETGKRRIRRFLLFNPNNLDLLIQMLDGCAFNNNFWVFYAATTNVEFTVTVTDTTTNDTKTYFNPLGIPAPPILDTTAFATCP